MRTSHILIIPLVFLAGCKEAENSSSKASDPLSCKGIYYTRDSSGALRKYNQYEIQGQCYTDNLALSKLETTTELWTKNNVACLPVIGFASKTLKSAGNYYQYRNERIWLSLDAQTGVFRRLVLSEDQNGNPGYSKLQSCFYYREGQGIDQVYGKQLLLDTRVDRLITSQAFDPQEVFKISNESPTELNLTRWDNADNSWDFRDCPYLSVPWGTCQLLQMGGNDFYFPTLTSQQKSDLLNEALLIGKEYNYLVTSKSAFEVLWQNVSQTRKELDYTDQKYHVIQNSDTPWAVDQSWMAYIRNERPWMPDLTNYAGIRMRPICYPSSREVTYSDNSTGKIFGEACYRSDGTLAFQPN